MKPWHLGVEYQLDNFFVDANYQGQGVGTELLASIKNDLIKNDIPAIILETEMHTPAEKFYRRNGFEGLAQQRSLALTCRLI
ncbi:Acetyltransferase [Leuconostoc pseudomesenteroides 4882]|nr:Acetyltransferase [Leuconostoc pseudomesenteroides 4882]